jgi:hypothetical protein
MAENSFEPVFSFLKKLFENSYKMETTCVTLESVWAEVINEWN